MAHRKKFTPQTSSSPGLPSPCGYSTSSADAKQPEVKKRPSQPQAAFLQGVRRMITNQDIVFDHGNLIVRSPQRLASAVLPRYFKHSKFSSFQRQLHYFGFRKIVGRGKLEPQIFYNHTLRGNDPGAILHLRRRSKVGSAESYTNKPLTQQPLSKYFNARPEDIDFSISTNHTTEEPLETTTGEMRAGTKDTATGSWGRAATTTSGSDTNQRPNVRDSRIERRSDASSESSEFWAGDSGGGGDRSGGRVSHGGQIPLLITALESNGAESGGDDRGSPGSGCERTFRGWQSPLWSGASTKNDGGGAVMRCSGAVTAPVARGIDGDREGDDIGSKISVTRNYVEEHRAGSGSSAVSSRTIRHPCASVQLDIDGRHGTNRDTSDSTTPRRTQKRVSRCSPGPQGCERVSDQSRVIDLPPALLARQCPSSMATTATQVAPNNLDAAHVPPFLAQHRVSSSTAATMRTSSSQFGAGQVSVLSGQQNPFSGVTRVAPPFGNQIEAPVAALALSISNTPSPPSHSDGDSSIPFRHASCNRDAEFDRKNFGDSILGECSVAEGQRVVDSGNYWGGDGNGCAVGEGFRKRTDVKWSDDIDPERRIDGRASEPWARTCSPESKVALFGAVGGARGVWSPEQLPLTPSPLSLRYVSYPMPSLLGRF